MIHGDVQGKTYIIFKGKRKEKDMDIKKEYKKLAEWLMSWGADRWLHFLVGLLVGYIVTSTFRGPLWVCMQLGFVASFVIGAVKECMDAYFYDDGDWTDLLFCMVGGLMGALLYGITIY